MLISTFVNANLYTVTAPFHINILPRQFLIKPCLNKIFPEHLKELVWN